MQKLKADDVEWVVNDYAELGVKIGDQFFFLYKGGSLVYETGKHDDGTPMMYRMVGKREFGECCHPVKFYKEGARLPRRYTDELVYTPGLSFGKPEDGAWKELPAASNDDQNEPHPCINGCQEAKRTGDPQDGCGFDCQIEPFPKRTGGA